MKECPICNSISFDDAETCFGCLHRFDTREDVDEEDTVAEPPERIEVPLVELAKPVAAPLADPASVAVAIQASDAVSRMSGRATLRRKSGAAFSAEPEHAAQVHPFEVVGNGVRYELVVSLQPVG